jgi:hypothetical protein
VYFNIIYGDPHDPTEPENEETPPDNWFVEKLGTAPPLEEDKKEFIKFLSPFKESQPSPEYEAYTNKRY